MFNEASIMYNMVKDLNEELTPLLELLNRKVTTDLAMRGLQQADAAFACRETITLLKEMTTKVNALFTTTKVVCNYVMMEADKQRLGTKRVTVTPKPKQWFKITVKKAQDPADFMRLQKFCGVPEDVADREVLRIHAPNFMDWMTELKSKGLEMPVNPGAVIATEFDLNIRKKTGAEV